MESKGIGKIWPRVPERKCLISVELSGSPAVSFLDDCFRGNWNNHPGRLGGGGSGLNCRCNLRTTLAISTKNIVLDLTLDGDENAILGLAPRARGDHPVR